MKLNVNCRTYEIEHQPDTVMVDGTPFKTSVVRDNGTITVKVGGRPYKVALKDDNKVVVDGRPFNVEVTGRAVTGRPKPKAASVAIPCAGEDGAVRAPMPGRVLAVRTQEGQEVAAGGVLLIIEAMKMENEIKAPHGGKVKRIAVAPGQNVCNGEMLVVVE